MRIIHTATICAFLCCSAVASQKFTASDGSYVFSTDEGWQARKGPSPFQGALLELLRDNAAGITVAREGSEEIRGVSTGDILDSKLQTFAARGRLIAKAMPSKKRTIGGMEAVEVEFESVAHDGKGIKMESRLVMTVIRESETSVLVSIASCRLVAVEKYLGQLRTILDSISKAPNQPPEPMPLKRHGSP